MKLRQIENSEALTAVEALLKYGLNWQVGMKDVFVDGRVVPDYRAVVREDNGRVFQIAGGRYVPVQNSDALRLLDEVVKSGGAKYVNGGSYNGGAVTWLRAKLPFDFDVLPNDRLNTYLKIVSSHDGSKKITVFPEVYRQVCTNGMHALVQEYTKTVAVKHTENAPARFVFNAQAVLADEVRYFELMQANLQALAKKQFLAVELDSFLYKLFNVEGVDVEKIPARSLNQIDQIKDLVHVGQGQDLAGIQGTAYSVYNAVTEYVDKYAPVRGDEDGQNREFSASFGAGADLRERAFAALLAR